MGGAVGDDLVVNALKFHPCDVTVTEWHCYCKCGPAQRTPRTWWFSAPEIEMVVHYELADIIEWKRREFDTLGIKWD